MDNVIETLVVQLVGDLSDLEATNAAAQTIIDEVTESQETLRQEIESTTTATVENTDAIREQVEAQQVLDSLFGESRRRLEEVTEQATNYERELQSLTEQLEQTRNRQQQVQSSVDGLTRAFTSIPGPIGRTTRQFMGLTQSIGGFVQGAMGMLPLIAGIGLAIGAIVIPILGAYHAIRRFIGEFDGLDRVGKKAAAMGESVTKLQSLSHALKEVAGMDASKTEAALQRLQRTVGQAAEGSGKAAKAFAELGLNAQQMAAMTPTDQFRAVAKAMENYGSQTDKARLAQDIFGHSSKEVILALTTQAEALREAEEWAKKYGLTITDSQSEAIQSANDSLGRVTDAIQGWFVQFAAEFAPLVQVIADYILTWIPPAGEFKEGIKFVVDLTAVLLGVLIDVGKVLGGIALITRGELSDGFKMMKEGLSAKSGEEILTKMEAARFEATKLAEAKERERNIAKEINKELEEQEKKAAKLKDSTTSLVESLRTQFEFMSQENSPDGEKNRKIWELEQQGASPEQLDVARFYEEKIEGIKAERAEQEKLTKEIEKRQQAEEAAMEKNKNYVSSLQERFRFKSQEDDPNGEKNEEIWKMEQQGVDPQLVEAARFFDEQIKAIEEKQRKAKEEAQRGLELTKQYRDEQEKIIDQAQELQDLLNKGLITPETFESGIKALNAGLEDATTSASRFWDAMNGPQMSEFGIGREGLEKELVGIRNSAKAELLIKEGGANPELARAEAIRKTEKEGTRSTDTEAKLVNVLDMLQQRLQVQQTEPNTLQLQLVENF
jgi:hypothetical protein